MSKDNLIPKGQYGPVRRGVLELLKEKNKSLQDISHLTNVSISYVSKIKKKAIERGEL